jgi:tRNA-dihydrouridine synthase
MDNFWQKLPKPFFVLAPMEGVTDVVFRHVVSHSARPDVFFTEFTNTASYCSPKGQKSTRSRLENTPDETPLVVQIWGKNPEHFAQMSADMRALGFSGIDINMGCPDKSVVRGGSCSALIRTPDLASQIINACKTSDLPVSVKTRLGDRRIDEWREWLGHILRQDIANLTIHLRTRKELSQVPAHFELIPEIVALRDSIAPKTLLTINGDIIDRQHGEALAHLYGVDGVMIGRGVFQNPFAFEAVKREHSKQELIALLNTHLDIFDQYSTEESPRKYDPLKRFFKIYIRDFDGASDIRAKLMETKNTAEARQVLASTTSA